jgi:hypothetical protein
MRYPNDYRLAKPLDFPLYWVRRLAIHPSCDTGIDTLQSQLYLTYASMGNAPIQHPRRLALSLEPPIVLW